MPLFPGSQVHVPRTPTAPQTPKSTWLVREDLSFPATGARAGCCLSTLGAEGREGRMLPCGVPGVPSVTSQTPDW